MGKKENKNGNVRHEVHRGIFINNKKRKKKKRYIGVLNKNNICQLESVQI